MLCGFAASLTIWNRQKFGLFPSRKYWYYAGCQLLGIIINLSKV